MKWLRRFWRRHIRRHWFDYEWPVVGILAAVVMVLGCIGFRLQLIADGGLVQWPDLLFRSFQLFVLQVSVEPPMPWQLNVARMAAPLVAGYTALQAFGHLVADQFQSLHLRLLRKHVVICGLGRRGLILARTMLDRGQTVVVIEEDAENDHVAQCRDAGGVVLLGDAADPEMLHKARVGRAIHLFALCGDDGVNAEIAVRTARAVMGKPGGPLTCALHVLDARLCTLLRERTSVHHSGGRIRLEFFNTFDLGARVLLERHRLWPPGEDPLATASRLVIVGVGCLGESLLVNAARQWQAAGAAATKRLQVTLIDQQASEITRVLHGRYPSLARTCDVDAHDLDVSSAAFQQAGFLAARGPSEPPALVFICLDDDALSLAAGLALAAHGHARNHTIVIRMAENSGLAVLLNDMDPGGTGSGHLKAFGLLDGTCDPEELLRGTYESLARASHEDYLRQQLAAGVKAEHNSSLQSWESLPEHLRAANRAQADHIGAKLEAVGCGLAPQHDWDEPLFEFADEELEALARMEHDRWLREKQRIGWRYGAEKSDVTKTHPSMIPYDELSEAEKDKDRSVVRQIPAHLARVGFRVVRLRGNGPSAHRS